jgi:hypothetical protein
MSNWTLADILGYKARTGQLGQQKHAKTERKEAELQQICEKILKNRGIWYLHLREPRRNKVGVPDLIAIYRGKAICVELKTKSKMRLSQLRNQAEIRANGGIAETIYSEQEFIELLDSVK